MKLEEYIESIFGCLERIENKINGLSVPLPEGNSPTYDSYHVLCPFLRLLTNKRALKCFHLNFSYLIPQL